MREKTALGKKGWSLAYWPLIERAGVGYIIVCLCEMSEAVQVNAGPWDDE